MSVLGRQVPTLLGIGPPYRGVDLRDQVRRGAGKVSAQAALRGLECLKHLTVSSGIMLSSI